MSSWNSGDGAVTRIGVVSIRHPSRPNSLSTPMSVVFFSATIPSNPSAASMRKTGRATESVVASYSGTQRRAYSYDDAVMPPA